MKNRIAIGLLLAAVVQVYGNTLWNGFTMDDDLYISLNPQVTDLSVRELFVPHKISEVFRPLTFGTFALNWALGGPRPWGFHLVNLLLHAAVTWLLYLLLREVLAVASPQGKTAALVAALLFAVHPIHTEAVASITGRAELLAAAFLLAGCILHLRDREISALVCFVLAVLSKESAVVFLPLVFVCDYAAGEWKSHFRYVRIAVVTMLYLGLLWMLHGGRFAPAGISRLDNPLAALPAGWRMLNALRVAWMYVGLQAFPRTLSCDYSFNQIPVYLDWRHTLPAAVALAAALAAWMWAVHKHRPGLVLAGGIYLAGFATTANILVPIGTIMGERLAYLPSAGFCLLVALGWSWLLGHGQQSDRRRTLAFGVLVAVLAALAVRTSLRNLDWKNNRALYSSAVVAVPRSAKMHADLGDLYVAAGQFDLARTELQTALEIYPDFTNALESYGVMEYRLGHYQAAGWMMEKALYTSPRNSIHYDFMAVNLAALYIQTGHIDGALELLNREIAESPHYARAWSNRAVVHYKRGEMTAARADAETALRLDPGNTQAQSVIRLLNSSSSPPPAQ
jgi:protein O-mannosyl-transferase